MITRMIIKKCFLTDNLGQFIYKFTSGSPHIYEKGDFDALSFVTTIGGKTSFIQILHVHNGPVSLCLGGW